MNNIYILSYSNIAPKKECKSYTFTLCLLLESKIIQNVTFGTLCGITLLCNHRMK